MSISVSYNILNKYKILFTFYINNAKRRINERSFFRAKK